MRDPNNHPTTGLSVVCSLPTTDQRQPYRFRGYPHPGRNDIHDFGKDCMIWEAARATTAAPTFFKPITITNGSEKKDFLDAALSFNNPTGEILKEAAEILEPTRELGCVLTLGTGTRAKSLERPASCSLLGIRWVFTKLIPALKSHTTDSERVHSDYEERFTDFKDSYFRFNLPDGADAVKLHQYKKMDDLKEMTRKYLQTNPEARRNMDRLVSVLAKRRTQGLTVGLACAPKRDQIILDQRRMQSRGRVSTFFTGRRSILGALSEWFSTAEPRARGKREFLLYGMGGMGKTQIALKFVEMCEDEDRFKDTFWVDAASVPTILDSFTAIASYLRLEASSGQEAVSEVLRWMDESTGDWLLVMDNVEIEDSGRFLPRRNKGNILYTSRSNEFKQWLPDGAVREVNTLSRMDSVTLLLTIAGRTPETVSYREIGGEIVDELGCLPLAIDQAGAYIKTMRYYLQQYLDEFRREKQRMLKEPRFRGTVERNLPVYATFDISYRTLQRLANGPQNIQSTKQARLAIKILCFICFYHNENIMEDMIARGAEFRASANRAAYEPPDNEDLSLEEILEVRNEEWDPYNFNLGTDLLESLSLLKRASARGKTISMHVLAHDWARDRMSGIEKKAFSKYARSVLMISIGHDPRNPYEVLYRRRILPHAIKCQELVTARGDAVAEAEHDSNLANMARTAGLLDEAAKILEQSAYNLGIEMGRCNWVTLWLTRELPKVYIDQGRFIDAYVYLTALIEYSESELGPGPGDESTWMLLQHLSYFYCQLGLHQLAYKTLETVRTSYHSNKEKVYSHNDWPEILQAEFRTVTHELDKYAKLSAQLVQARKEADEAITRNGTNVEASMSDCEILTEQGVPVPESLDNLSEAPNDGPVEVIPDKVEEALWRDYMAHVYKTGLDSQDTLRALDNLATHKRNVQERLSCALIIRQESLRRSMLRHGPHDLGSILRYQALATEYLARNDFKKAFKLHEMALKYSRASYPEGSLHILIREVAYEVVRGYIPFAEHQTTGKVDKCATTCCRAVHAELRDRLGHNPFENNGPSSLLDLGMTLDKDSKHARNRKALGLEPVRKLLAL